MIRIASAGRGNAGVARLIRPNARKKLSARSHRSVQVEVHIQRLAEVIRVAGPSLDTAHLRIQLPVQVRDWFSGFQRVIRTRASAVIRVVDLPVAVVVLTVVALSLTRLSGRGRDQCLRDVDETGELQLRRRESDQTDTGDESVALHRGAGGNRSLKKAGEKGYEDTMEYRSCQRISSAHSHFPWRA